MQESIENYERMSEQIADRTNLSPTRAKVLTLIKLHKSKEEIADILSVTERTVQNHIQDIRSEITAARELIDMAGRTHYGDESLYKEFGGSLWQFRSGMRYQKNADTTIERKLYGSPHGACLLVEREISSSEGSITESRTRTEFYDGNDIVPYLSRQGKYGSYDIAVLHTAFIANAGIDPKYAPSDLVQPTVEVPEEVDAFEKVEELIDESSDGWVTL